jgi:iron complex transport system substrate-binding protein
VRVVSLLPAATEIVAALGELNSLVGVSHECDYPPAVRRLPQVTASPVDVGASSAAIDDEVRRLQRSGKPVIGIDADQLRSLAPDLILTQDLCEVCAVSDGEVYRLAAALNPAPRVLSLRARDLAGIWADIRSIGAALSLEDEAEELVLGLRSRLGRLRLSHPPAPQGVLCIEWLDPLFLAGHWVPELVTAAGGRDLGATPGSHSTQREWQELRRLGADRVIVMLCGFGVDRARAELDSVSDPDALELLRNQPVWILDGNSYTSRPGPRVVDGAARIQAALINQVASGLEAWLPAAQYAEN